jgi:hypothetical protein
VVVQVVVKQQAETQQAALAVAVALTLMAELEQLIQALVVVQVFPQILAELAVQELLL